MRHAYNTMTAALLILALTGCGGTTIFSDYREVEDLELVRTVCVDSAEGGGVNVLVCATPTGEKTSLRMFEREAPGIAIALSELRKTSTGREAILSHTENLVLGEEEARRGVGNALDYVVRYGEIRLDTSFFIVRGGRGRDFMTGIGGETTSPASVLAGLQKSLPLEGEGYVFTCRDAAVSLAENGCALVMAVRGEEEEKLFEGRGDMRASPAGFALIVDGKLRDFLTEDETLGALLLREKLKSRSFDVEVGGKRITLSVNRVKTEVEPRVENGRFTGVTASVYAEAAAVNADSGVRLEDPAVRGEAERFLAEKLQRSAEAALRRCVTEGTDFLELRSAAEMKYPRELHGVTAAGFAAMLQEAGIEARASAAIKRTYDVTDSLNESGEEGESAWKRVIKSLSGN